MKTWEAKTKNCPVMSQPVVYMSSTGHPYSTMHWQLCSADQCPMWVGDRNEGRCGMIRITDAEAMKMNLTGTL